jgi:hypothetical protein
MKKHSLSDRKAAIRLFGRERCQHDRLDRAALPPKFSYRKKPITMAVPVLFTKCNCAWAELLGNAIRQYTELAGILPASAGGLPIGDEETRR